MEELEEVIQEIADYPNIEIIGLMTMAPYEAEEDELNHIFSSLKMSRRKLHVESTLCPLSGIINGHES